MIDKTHPLLQHNMDEVDLDEPLPENEVPKLILYWLATYPAQSLIITVGFHHLIEVFFVPLAVVWGNDSYEGLTDNIALGLLYYAILVTLLLLPFFTSPKTTPDFLKNRLKLDPSQFVAVVVLGLQLVPELFFRSYSYLLLENSVIGYLCLFLLAFLGNEIKHSQAYFWNNYQCGPSAWTLGIIISQQMNPMNPFGMTIGRVAFALGVLSMFFVIPKLEKKSDQERRRLQWNDPLSWMTFKKNWRKFFFG